MLGVANEASGAQHVAYPVADLDDPSATLVERDWALGPQGVIQRDRWRFARLDGGALLPDRTHVYLRDRFAKDKTYELIYSAEGAVLTGLGLAALRDGFRFCGCRGC